ncbi:helix-turn-helix transcriptional regulator [Roseateles puraquae]|jgi:DNA-binding CsgD family transcriptional regulator|uniref:LuxR family transcriptional regulator n=1 Tax=Roseateles puraquae TaxID=431059 RepID=A0A254NBX4_9BURK|nr:autoinducer binding domain-containing protein [Roseateles puraquae]MDG0852517.1 LuxR family transcriptional regulator [Roseateles puraquae]OWR05240.1 LuxR family transcriptional regulator [Roseateles puraquae]
MNLQRYEQVSQAADFDSFRQGLIDFAGDLDFGLISGVLAVERKGPGAKTEYFSVGNTPAEFLAAQVNPENAKRDPVHRHVMTNAAPLIYDQRLYVDAGSGDLWEMQAPFGYRTGLAVSVHMPGYRRFLLGVDRHEPLPSDPIKLNRMIADLQLLAVHAQDAAARLLVPTKVPRLPARQLEILRLTMEGKSAWVVGSLLGISENTVNYHLKQLFKQLDVSNKNHAVLKAMELGLL